MATEPRQIRIGIWGGTRSGKTTFLAALQIASLQDAGQWMIVGQDQIQPESNKFLGESTRDLQIEHRFPEATQALDHFCYRASGNATEQHLTDIRDPRVETAIRGRQVDFLDFRLDLLDEPGNYLLNNTAYQNELWQYLASCDGIVYLYDLTQPGENLRYLTTALPLVALACELAPNGSRLLPNRRLPHYLAVCGVKYDDNQVFSRLVNAGQIVVDARTGRAVPRVKDPTRIFDLFPNGLTQQFLVSFFERSRTHVFASSAIGFHTPDPRRIDLNNAFNTEELGDGTIAIRGDIHPVNVFTPFVWIVSRVLLG